MFSLLLLASLVRSRTSNFAIIEKLALASKGVRATRVCDSDSVGNATFETQQGPGTPEIGVYDQGQSINETSNITRAVGSIDLFA